MDHDPFLVTRFLRMQPWFASLEPGQQELLLRRSHVVRADAGEVLLPARQYALGWYAVVWGFVKLQAPATAAPPAAFLALTAGEWFGEASVLGEAPRIYEVVALRRSEVLSVPREVVHELAGKSLPFNQVLLRHVSQRLLQSMAVITAQRMGNPEQRLGLYLSRHFWHGLVQLRLSQTELGYLAGLSRQTVNRALRGLAERGLVTLVDGRVAAVDHAGLEQFLGTPVKERDAVLSLRA